MVIKFGGGPPKPTTARSSDPIKIFQARPAIESQINDLWSGQSKALEQWYAAKQNDVLIALNTGAGKSILGSLICQSWLNSGVQNPVYLCATNDLVEQTSREATKLALKFTTRVGGVFNNELFESGQGFLITSYQTLFNAKTRLRGALSPGGIVFDDAHVGEPVIRSQFTLTVDAKKDEAVFKTLVPIVEAHLTPTDRQKLRLVLDIHGAADTFLCPPDTGRALNETMSALANHFGTEARAEIHFPYQLLATHFDACAVVVRTDAIEFSPPFLPTKSLTPLRDPNVKRVYLSATLKAHSEFVRAYGRQPGLVIEPEVDAGNGERTILPASKLSDRDQLVSWTRNQSLSGKVLIATPSRSKATAWASIAKPPEVKDFNEELRKFRIKEQGGFILAGRFDGIDLPDATCRLMIISGLPSGGSQLETYLWEVFEMQNLLAARVATRVTQLFGRIIRGRNDYGTFITHSTDLNSWISRDRNLALLPELLQKQIKLGTSLIEDYDINNLGTVSEFYNQVLSREEGWLEYYRSYVDEMELDVGDVERREANEAAQLRSSLAESRFIEAMWNQQYSAAADTLDTEADAIASNDSKLAGWLNLWAGAARTLAGDDVAARDHYRLAASRLPLKMSLPTEVNSEDFGTADAICAGDAALRALTAASARSFAKRADQARATASIPSAPVSSSAASEEAYRAIGAALGFKATRPDEEYGAGPDALWIDEITNAAISFELKTDKISGSDLNKKEIGQSHNHIQWISDKHHNINLVQHFIVGSSLTVANNASPDPKWKHSDPAQLLTLMEAFIAEARRIRNMPSGAKSLELSRLAEAEAWSIGQIVIRLTDREFAP